MLKLNQTQLYRLILTGHTNESSEFFQSPVKVTQLLNMESDTFNQKMLTAFSENSDRQPLSSVDIDDMKRLEARYKYYLADSYFTEGALTMEIYMQVVHEDDLQIIESALKDVENYELEKVNIIEESKLNSSSCCGLYLLEQEESRNLSFFINKQYEEILVKEDISQGSRLLSVKFRITNATYNRHLSDPQVTKFLQENYEAFLFNKIDPTMAAEHLTSKVFR